MRLLITRPSEDAVQVAALLRARGHDAVIEPLLSIVYVKDAVLDLSGLQAVLITSANGARALSQASDRRDLKLLTVGAGSRQAAQDLGFRDVTAAGGDVAALAALVAAQCDPSAGKLLHVAGKVTAGDLAGQLEKQGFAVTRRVLYEAQSAQRLSSGLIAALRGKEIHGVLLYSPRTAALFAGLIGSAGLAADVAGLNAYCLSQGVADALNPGHGMRILVASRPEQDSLLTLLN